MPVSFRPRFGFPRFLRLGRVSGRIVLWLVLFVASLIILAPATCWDSVLRQATQGNFSLLMAEGSLWNGNAQLAVLDPVSGQQRPLMPASWKWNTSHLMQGTVSWDFSLAASPPFTLDVTLSGITLRAARLEMPARMALERIPNAIGRVGWHGDLRIMSPYWHCSWTKVCDGSLSVDWLGTAADIFPGRHLGDYRLNAEAKSSVFDINLTTTSGEVRIDATGKWKMGGNISVSGKIEGDPEFTSRLPNIAGRWVQPTSTPGSFTFSFSN